MTYFELEQKYLRSNSNKKNYSSKDTDSQIYYYLYKLTQKEGNNKKINKDCLITHLWKYGINEYFIQQVLEQVS